MDVASVDPPKKKYKTDPAQMLKAKKRYVRKMATELGWEVRAKKNAKPR